MHHITHARPRLTQIEGSLHVPRSSTGTFLGNVLRNMLSVVSAAIVLAADPSSSLNDDDEWFGLPLEMGLIHGGVETDFGHQFVGRRMSTLYHTIQQDDA